MRIITATEEAGEAAAIVATPILCRTVPGMAIEDGDGSSAAEQLSLTRVRGSGVSQGILRMPATQVGAGDHACCSVVFSEIHEHPERVTDRILSGFGGWAVIVHVERLLLAAGWVRATVNAE